LRWTPDAKNLCVHWTPSTTNSCVQHLFLDSRESHALFLYFGVRTQNLCVRDAGTLLNGSAAEELRTNGRGRQTVGLPRPFHTNARLEIRTRIQAIACYNLKQVHYRVSKIPPLQTRPRRSYKVYVTNLLICILFGRPMLKSINTRKLKPCVEEFLNRNENC